MNIKNQIIGAILGIEGGYVNNPDDSGGATRWGVTEKVARLYGYTGDMRYYPKESAIRVYSAEYWHKMNLDEIAAASYSIAYILMDIGINAGTGRAAKFLQRYLNVMNQKGTLYRDIVADGALGRRTIMAFNAYYRHRGAEGLAVMADSLKAMQLAFYIELAERREKDETFAYGWAIRARKEPHAISEIMEA